MEVKSKFDIKKAPNESEEPRIDPVCKMPLRPWEVKFEVHHAGESHVFCSSECRQTFLLFPERFSGRALHVA